MNEEDGFIASLLADPNDETVLLVYADWLDERSDPRAEYLRLLVAEHPNEERVSELRATLDGTWIRLLATREFSVGKRVRFCFGPFAPLEGEVTAIGPDRIRVTVRVLLWGRPADLEGTLAGIELV